MDTSNKKHENIFNSLVNNAIDFLDESINQLQEKPKHSVINFFNSIELFIKAKLMLEHWSLIIEDSNKANYDSFINGDFKSVGIDSAISRLKNISKVTISQPAIDMFRKIKQHRNQAVHFYHRDLSKPISNQNIQNIVSEQCAAWFYLHRFLTQTWKNEFTNFQEKIDVIHLSMRKRNEYLQVKFDDLSQRIESERQKGVTFTICSACGFGSNKLMEIIPPLYSNECLVCDIRDRTFHISCPRCNDIIGVKDGGEGACDKCSFKVDYEYLIGKFGVGTSKTKHQLDEIYSAYCSSCDFFSDKTVVPINGRWICLTCLQDYENLDQCDFCGEFVAGDLEDSAYSGCNECEGASGYYA